jgi:YHS domain-containing protein
MNEKPTTVKDPVCGMTIGAPKAREKSEYQGETYSFCSIGCKQKFDSVPDRYAQPPNADLATSNSGGVTVIDRQCGSRVF